MTFDMRPIIGITPSVSERVIKMRENYAEAILDVGGIPVFLPHTVDGYRLDEYCDMLDGLLFAGGADVDPRYYGERVEFDSVEISAERDEFELALFSRFNATGKPILGICRGIQLINVALGGSLYQHIEGHRQTGGGAPQTVNVLSGSLLSAAIGADGDIPVNSYHHQAVKRIAEGLAVSATSPDGTVEALERTEGGFLLAVQWHPEMIYRDETRFAGIFATFVKAARGRSEL